ncbi:acyl-CoA dehydrogenase [Geobacter metallireducens GS-15]|uniref:Acyl-CoA dehydrogenase n=1 Tax=Geobacter metallireducens (strain ATCC 53774 / DSM 7210 / GS-15) TaxID=269799 RepID=Q39TJ8_GEOMG|nr:acyl-CoA dehydrogenase [Geobacter metallireducens]ABB32426.1 acyl-CoA dehydrogenase [Geobacter metallireducens GS-15]
MEIELNSRESAILEEVRRFLKSEVTPELLAESHHLEYIYGGEEGRKFVRKFAANGWLTPCWPEEYGGLNSSEMLMYAIRNEMAYARVPIHFAGAHMAGPSILRYGNDDLKKNYLLRLASGEIEFALGYSEPAAGSDLMGLEMRAADKGDHLIVNGQKTFNTHAHVADYHWLAVRTNLEGPKHKGISILIVDLKSPGITIRPMITMAGTRTNEVFYDDVVVPRANLVGEINSGFKYIMAALDFERMFPFGHYKKFYEDLVAYLKTVTRNGMPLTKDPLVRQKLAQLEIELEIIHHLYFQLAHMLDNGKIPNYQASMEKNFLTDFEQRLANTALEILGARGQLREGANGAILDGLPEWLYRWTVIETIYGGTAEIQRNIMAQRGLGLPRA